ncbi:FadR/GntR family transcriptional regulator [Subtercola frigoramans]|uniref:DNA-binding FadR family transcriptional regulator n=1 Tax=Subtercola frigoramans TaxID=120298 RepID=A0ABS2L065_9MICO|nr:FadR/GntR family transcriptional regulator [Subtercola frigoramans]MBM7470475.1 DNA-binding FadR family transcriptional regulator [Subtercola frigoramans]
MSDESSLSQTDVVVFGIKQMILDGELTPGARLPIEKDLAPRLNVSRGSLREGVRALSIMGVLETRQGAGTFVTALDPSLLLAPMGFVVDLQHAAGIENVHTVRRILETAAAGRAVSQMTQSQLDEASRILDRSEVAISSDPIDHETALDCDIEFHRLISANSGNAVLAALIEALSSRTVRGRLWRAIADENALFVTLAEHRAILASIAKRDPEAAQLRMGAHLLAVEEFLAEHEPDQTAV